MSSVSDFGIVCIVRDRTPAGAIIIAAPHDHPTIKPRRSGAAQPSVRVLHKQHSARGAIVLTIRFNYPNFYSHGIFSNDIFSMLRRPIGTTFNTSSRHECVDAHRKVLAQPIQSRHLPQLG
jgi:hypothetical protein